MKIGVYTIHRLNNYGAMLQAYATQETLITLGHSPEFINVYTVDEEKRNNYRNSSANLKQVAVSLYARISKEVQGRLRKFQDFHDRVNVSRRYFSAEELRFNPRPYDIHLVGSDQVWNLENGLNGSHYRFLDFLDKSCRRISYASSFGSNLVPEDIRDQVGGYLRQFSAISCRESSGCEIVRAIAGVEATEVMDPTFLLNASQWGEIAVTPNLSSDYVLCYLDGSNLSNELMNFVRKQLGLPIVFVSVSLFHPHKVDYFLRNVGPLEFLGLIKNAKFVCSSSYHGMIVSIIFRKNFLGTCHPTRNARMQSMLEKLKLERRQVCDSSQISFFGVSDLEVDYAKLDSRLSRYIDDSKAWLAGALKHGSN